VQAAAGPVAQFRTGRVGARLAGFRPGVHRDVERLGGGYLGRLGFEWNRFGDDPVPNTQRGTIANVSVQ
jgi:hypothetical protein